MSSVTRSSICPYCHTPNPGGSAICENCGLVFATYSAQAGLETAAEPLPQPPTPSPRCPRCRHTIDRMAVQCPHCGNPLYRSLLPGESLSHGRYTVKRALSKGGMGAIYLAVDHEAFDRLVVIKAMLDYFDATNPVEVEAARDHFVQEARTLSTLSHPAIPKIYTYFQEGPHNYFVMEYIESHDLEQAMIEARANNAAAPTPYALADVLRWGVELCRVLEYLAARKPYPVVHQDIKPANILLDTNGDIRLVDFGTARARLLAQSGGGLGLHKSSSFGTRGYAPLEQYQGRSEPRSDVYALAATLYHLATGDDPRLHPFSFPLLDQLGDLGRVLAVALRDTVNTRSGAAELRQQLELLLKPSGIHPIQTPDGQEVRDERELAAWCERNWMAAAQWIYDHDKLPQQIERFWGKNGLAAAIRVALEANPADHHAGLDAVIALLDPAGFGVAAPALTSRETQLNYGSLPAHGRKATRVTITNSGRRYIHAHLGLPDWIEANSTLIVLPPGQGIEIMLAADMQQTTFGGKLEDSVTIEQGGARLATLQARAEVSRWRTFWQHYFERKPRVHNGWQGGSARLAQIIPAHTGAVRSVAFSADGQILASGGNDMFVRLWRASDGRPLHDLAGHSDKVEAVAFRPNGLVIASGSSDRAVKLWQVSDGNLLHTLSGQSGSIQDLAFSPFGQLLAAADWDRQIALWQLSDGSLRQTLTGHEDCVLSVVFSPDGRYLASGSGDETVRLWNASDGSLLQVLPWQGTAILSVAFSPDGKLLAAGGWSKQVKIWNLRSGALLHTLSGHESAVGSITFSPDGQVLASGSTDRLIQLWHTRSGALLQTLGESSSEVASVAFSPDARTLAAACGDGSMMLWRIEA